MTNRIIFIVIFIVIAMVLAVILVLPGYRQLQSFQAGVELRQAELQRTRNYFADLRNISEELKENQEALLKIDSALPPELSLPSFLDYLEKISAENNLILGKIGQVRSSASGQRSHIREHHLSFSLSGSYSSFKEWLNTLEKSSRLIEITSIRFSSPESREEPVDFGLGIKFYSY